MPFFHIQDSSYSLIESFQFMIFKRWYVFTFLLAYLAVASYFWGIKRSLFFILIGYSLAWLSEASSIRNGFPYGLWEYHYDQMSGELLIWGVPFWDSLSYTFLCFAGYMMALFLRKRFHPDQKIETLCNSWRTIIGGAACTTLLDIVIDPVAHRGAEWFLGEIYHYSHPGIYFEVPLSNFAGWFLVSFCILASFRFLGFLKNLVPKVWSIELGVALFAGIFLFNWSMTLYLKAWGLALASACWGGLLLFLALPKKKKN